MDLNCPRCQGGKLEEIELNDVLLDRCRTCGGLWFDQGEIAEITGLSGPVVEVEKGMTEDDAAINCPRCANITMRKQKVRNDDATETLVRCPSCLGTWIDRGILNPEQDSAIVTDLTAHLKKVSL